MWRWWTFVGDQSHWLLSVISRKGVLFSVTWGTLVSNMLFFSSFNRCYPIPRCPPRILSGIMDVLPSIGDISPPRIWDWLTSRNKFHAEIIILLLDPVWLFLVLGKRTQMHIIISPYAIIILTHTVKLLENQLIFIEITLYDNTNNSQVIIRAIYSVVISILIYVKNE